MSQIVIAYGCDIRDGLNHGAVVKFLSAEATSAGTDVWTYPKSKPAHSIRIVFSKTDFAAALDLKDAVVIYDGHSRIGQGPAFGPPSLPICPDLATYPVNPWGDSFRMGHDFADVECIGDIMHHGTNQKEYPLPTKTKGIFASRGLIDIVDDAIKAGKVKCSTPGGWRSFATCHPKVAAKTNCRGEATLASRHYWRARSGLKEFDTLVEVGDADLRKTKLACAVLFVNSCSSKRHFHAALARHKKEMKSQCAFFLTAEVCSSNTTLPFVKAVLAGKDVTKDGGAWILKRMNAIRGSGNISMES